MEFPLYQTKTGLIRLIQKYSLLQPLLHITEHTITRSGFMAHGQMNYLMTQSSRKGRSKFMLHASHGGLSGKEKKQYFALITRLCCNLVKAASKSPNLMNLIRKIFLITATYDFQASFKHILGICNAISDAYRCNCSGSWPTGRLRANRANMAGLL